MPDNVDATQGRPPIVVFRIIIATVAVLVVVAFVLYVGAKWTYQILYPVAPTETVSLSAGFQAWEPNQAATSNTPAASPQQNAENSASTTLPATPAAPTTPTSPTIPNSEAQKPSTSVENGSQPYFWVAGAVQKLGKPVTSGMVKLTVEKLTGDYRESELVIIKPDGSFYTSLWQIRQNDLVHVQAEVWSDQLTQTPLTEELYLGSPAPIHLRTPLYVIVGSTLLFSLFVFAYSFTGQQNALKNRVAIIYSYFVILVCLMLPLVGPYTIVHAFPGLEKAMKGTPVGLLVAKPDPDSNDSKPQWLLNIGGHVIEPDSTPSILEGGLAVPLYVIILSLMGGTINMTRQVPLLQNRAQTAQYTTGLIFRTWRSFILGLGPAVDEETVAVTHSTVSGSSTEQQNDWRTGLLNQYMYLVSAPFLAIATYYILYLLGMTKVPILVLVSFSVGLISEHILVTITDFADKVISGLKAKEAEEKQEESKAAGESAPLTPGLEEQQTNKNGHPRLDQSDALDTIDSEGKKQEEIMASGSLPSGVGAAPTPCKITPDSSGQCDFQIKDADTPVTIQLCENKNGAPATTTHFYQVKVFFQNTTNPAPNQPSQITNTTCKLPSLAAGQYDVQITVLHAPNAVGYVYEACGTPDFQHQLCDINTANQPNTSFSLRVV